MQAQPTTPDAPAPSGPQREIELPALVPILWSVAGGMLAGGGAVAVLVQTGRLSGHAFLATSAFFYVIGATLGLIHGVLLGLFGRPEGATPRQALRAMAHGLIYLVPALLLGWLVAGWVAALPITFRFQHLVAGVIAVGAALLMLVTVTVAAASGVAAARLAYRRWPDRVPGTVLVSGVFAALAVTFAIDRPVVWFLHLKLTPTGAALLVFALTFWFYGPLITVALALLRRVGHLRPWFATLPSWRELARRGATAVGAGLLIAMLALPFHEGVLGIPTETERLGTWPSLLVAIGSAVTDELLVRLFLMTVTFVIVGRYVRHTGWAIGSAVAVATVADLLLHWPEIAVLGLPSPSVVVAYAVTHVAVPALLLAWLFWKRGLGTAVTAHATANAALGLLAL